MRGQHACDLSRSFGFHVCGGLCALHASRGHATTHIQSTIQGIPSLLVGTGLTLTAIITLRLNPWTGALWMIWTFILIMIVMVQTPSSSINHREADVARHRLRTSYLAAFSWWGALQGFGPAIFILINGDDLSTRPYVGHQPGPFSPAFFLFFLAWAPFHILAAHLIRRYQTLHHT